jgi:topoisomerase-4 subunit A
MSEEKKNIENESNEEQAKSLTSSTKKQRLGGMYEDWFLDYASYVIMERAVPSIFDGLKPVQRRIMHAMKDLDDGRYNKVANIIGHTMKFHPHGDAAIGDALVQLGQKELLIDMQGNWGNNLTGDSAAAPRYIEARLSKFANDVVFNPKITAWGLSYDGRNKEPVNLPVKFPLLLAQGAEGIAVGLSAKILPHNFIELIDASIQHLKGKEFELFPDFLQGGYIDASKYNDGLRGGRVRVRAKISELDKKTLVITEIPFSTTTGSLIESIVQANEKGKIKIKKIEDNTANNVEIVVQLAPGISPDQTIDALYAFTLCEVSISPNNCVIDGDKPVFISSSDLLKKNTEHTKFLLNEELNIQLAELREKHFFTSLEKIFIEKKIYRDIEECETFEAIIETIDKGLDPYKKSFYREVVRDDILKLMDIKIKRISKYDSLKADEIISSLEDDIKDVEYHLEHLVEYSIDYFKEIKRKYGKGKERKSELKCFDNIEATRVVVANEKLYINREEGFAGTSLKKDEYVCDCSDIDEIIYFTAEGKFQVTKVSDKFYVGQNIIHIDVFKRHDERTVYNMVYRDGFAGKVMVKRFMIKGVTRDKEYDLTKGKEGSKVLYFTANPNGEAEVVKVLLKPKPRLRQLNFEYDFSELAIKGRSSQGNILTKHTVRKISLKEDGVSTLGARKIWFDDAVNRLNSDERGSFLGEFDDEDKIIVLYKQGIMRLYQAKLTTHFEDDILIIEKYNPKKIYSLVYFNGELKQYYLKRFQAEDTDKPQVFMDAEDNSKLIQLSDDYRPQIEVITKNAKGEKDSEIVNVEEFIAVKSYKARGKRLTTKDVKAVNLLDPLEYQEDISVEENLEAEEAINQEEETASSKEETTESVSKEKAKELHEKEESKAIEEEKLDDSEKNAQQGQLFFDD